MERETTGLSDSEVFKLVKKEKALLITRDHHFTNHLRFPPEDASGIIFIRKGNLTSHEEVDLIKWLFSSYSLQDFQGRLVTLSKDRVRIR